jgi:hypothetical protein
MGGRGRESTARMDFNVTMQSEAFDRFKSETRGEVLVPSDPRYDDTRKVWNAMIDRRPAKILTGRTALGRHAISIPLSLLP